MFESGEHGVSGNQMTRPTIISVDFDGTIVSRDFPEIQEPLAGAIETLKALKEAGYILILSTCRENQRKRNYLDEAVNWCASQGIVFDGVNQTPLEYEFRDPKFTIRKIYADVYIDDRNFGGFPGWDSVREAFLGNNDETDK